MLRRELSSIEPTRVWGDDAQLGSRRPESSPTHAEAQPYFTAWAETFSVPTVLLRLDRRIIWTNNAAERMLVDSALFTRQGGRLTCADNTQAGSFQNFLDRLGDEPEAWIGQSDHSRFVVRGESLRPAAEAPAAALMVYHTTAADRYVWADFGSVFELTRAEAVVAKILVNGGTAHEIAGQLTISVETVRTHIRRIYSKLMVSSREQFFAIISQFRID